MGRERRRFSPATTSVKNVRGHYVAMQIFGDFAIVLARRRRQHQGGNRAADRYTDDQRYRSERWRAQQSRL
jgi:hypothetical protein